MRGMKQAGSAWVWGLGLLGTLLLGLPASAAPKCEGGCTAKASESIKACMAQCPDPSIPGQKGMYATCSKRCSEKFSKRFEACEKVCDRKNAYKKEESIKEMSATSPSKKTQKKKKNRKRRS